MSTSIAKLLPDEVSLEVFNSQYLQKHSTRADAIFAAAQVSRTLGAAREEVESAVFNALSDSVELKLDVCLALALHSCQVILIPLIIVPADGSCDQHVLVRDQLAARRPVPWGLQGQVRVVDALLAARRTCRGA